eukprot:TRINITY_DN20997_c0_g1_i1.p1 TRINITY_DN20997_c0_g1~~TRINITY_DN20997_c0_g1_i1.p1  ORF type:complete len:726 (-),score=127.89 TRINITY_DN20997_c0_g1_i1:204-2348(-)
MADQEAQADAVTISKQQDHGDGALESLRAKLWRGLSDGQVIRVKEMREACAFYDAVRKDAKRCSPSLVIDASGGSGVLGMLFIAHGVASRALVINQFQAPSHEALRVAWAPFLCGRAGDGIEEVRCDQRPLEQALPQVLQSVPSEKILVVARTLSSVARKIADCCLAARASFAVCPCDPTDSSGSIRAAASALGVNFNAAMVIAEMGRLMPSCEVHLRSFDAAVSSYNLVLYGRNHCDKISSQAQGGTAEERLRRAYERAHRNPYATASAPEGPNVKAGLWSGQEAKAAVMAAGSGEDKHELEVSRKAEAVASLLSPLTASGHLSALLLKSPGMEIRRSPHKHFRARTVVAVGPPPPTSASAASDAGDSAGLFRLIPEERNFRLAAAIPMDTLLPAVAAALPALAELLGSAAPGLSALSPGLRCVKLHGTLGGSPTQLMLCFVYGPEAVAPEEEELELFRTAMVSALMQHGLSVDVMAMAQAKGVQRCAPSGTDYVDEVLETADGRLLRYRQVLGNFSNPNPHIAIATAEWLLDVVRQDVNAESAGAPSTDLLELYCGAGSHTLALAPLFRHVLAVEINRHLVAAANHNVALNGLSNVTVVRAPSEEFCKRVIRRRSYELRGEATADGPPIQLNFGCTVVDPPRAGLDPITLEAVAGYDHVLYVSCNPQALRSNLDVLLKTHEARRMVLLDHFPCSAHVEMAVHLRKHTRTEEG